MMRFRSIVRFILVLSIVSLFHSMGWSMPLGNTLIQSVDARAQGMGDSFSAVSGEEGGVLVYHYNPASIANLRGEEVALTYKKGIADDNFGVITFGSPLSIPSKEARWGTLAGTFIYYSVVDIDLIDSSGNLRTVTAQKDMEFVLSYGFNLWKILSIGANAKVLNSQLIESFSSTAYAVDLGTLIRWNDFSFSCTAQNIGTDLTYRNTGESIPMQWRTGVSYHYQWREELKTLWTIDFVRLKNEDFKPNFGAEYQFGGSLFPQNTSLSLRAGYQSGLDNGKTNFGLGFRFRNYQIDYSVQPMGDTGNNQLVSLIYSF